MLGIDLLYGYDKEPVSFVHNKRPRTDYYCGCVSDLQSIIDARTTSKGNLKMISFFSKKTDCQACRGTGMNSGVSDIRLVGHTLHEVDRLGIPDMLSFIKSLPQLMDANEFEIAGPVVSHLEQMLFYLSKIGLRTLHPDATRVGVQGVSS